MIIVCEKCDTRFQLDEARIPAKGARVRCSRCKHAFFVRRPDASAADAIDEVVAEATDPGASGVPDASRDLGEGGGIYGDEFESDWEFNEDPPAEVAGATAAAAAAAPRAASAAPVAPQTPPAAPVAPGMPAAARAAPETPPPVQEAPAALDAVAPEDDGFDGLGNPEEWNLLEDTPPPARRDVGSDPLEDLLDAGAASHAPAEASAAEAEAAPAEEERPRARGGAALGSLAAGIGWSLVLGLLGVAGLALLRPALSPSAAPRQPDRQIELPGGLARDVRGRWIENAIGGRLFVVSGRYDPGAARPEQGLEVHLLGADGAPLPGASSWAGPALSELQLRELAPEALREGLAQGASFLVSGAGGAFHAVFAEVPPEAADFSLRERRLPATSPPPPPAPSSE